MERRRSPSGPPPPAAGRPAPQLLPNTLLQGTDIEARTAKVSIPGILESIGQPIRSPATGDVHRVRIEIPNGIEFERAEIGSATTRARGKITLDLKDSYGQFNLLDHSGRGVVHAA